MHYQEINEILARGLREEELSADHAGEIGSANAYLIGREGKKPDWLDDFFESNKCKLVETICRATAAQQGISSIQGYREGYFSEIIQNANDLHCGEEIEITGRRMGERYELICSYPDQGFTLSNIYAFLNREMSDKIHDDRQTGKFGVGIKAFFKFVSHLKIWSNVLFDFRIVRDAEICGVSGTVAINPDWDGRRTVLEISYNDSVQNEFNTAKLSALIDFLCGRREADCAEFYVTGRDSELLFDIRSLIFMKLKAQCQKSVSRLVFSGAAHKIVIRCEDIDREDSIQLAGEAWRTGTIQLSMNADSETVYEKKYIYFAHGSFSTALPLGAYSTEKNRIYATYYLKEDSADKLCPSGLLFDTQSTNIYRIDVGDSEASINSVYDNLRNHLRDLYAVMCSEAASGLAFANKISDAFHHLVARYMLVDRQLYRESPLNYPYFDNAFLPKIDTGEIKACVVSHREKEAYDAAAYQEGDIVRELREHYLEFIERRNVYDLCQMLSEPGCIAGVKSAFEMFLSQPECFPEENYKIAAGILNYFDSVAAYLSFVISGRRSDVPGAADSEIDAWLSGLRNEVGKYFDASVFLKLVGRYQLNPAVNYDGSIIPSNLSFKDYLFNGTLAQDGGILAYYQNKQYDEAYYALKEGLLRERYTDPGNRENKYMIRCVRPVDSSVSGWDGTYDYYEIRKPKENTEQVPGLELLLEKLAVDKSLSSWLLDGTDLKLFEQSARGMRRRDYNFKYSTVDFQQIISLNCLKNIRLDKFCQFVNVVKYRAMLPAELKKYIRVSCAEKSISTADIIKDILPVITDISGEDKKTYILDEYHAGDVEIHQIRENGSNELSDEQVSFIRQVTGFHVHIYRFVSKTRRKIAAYFGNGMCAVKTDAVQKFREAARYCSGEKDVYIFYANYSGSPQDIVIDVLKEFDLSAKRLELMEGYIHSGRSAKAMNYLSRRRSLAKVKKKLLLDWVDVSPDELTGTGDSEILYRLLTARGSYDIFCPVCAEIPSETFDYGEDTRRRHSRKLILMENEHPDTKDEIPYIVTVACRYCCDRLQNVLSKAEFDGKNMILTTNIAHGTHEKMMSKQQIELSPVNIELMRKFRL